MENELVRACKELLKAVGEDERYRSHWDSVGNKRFHASVGLINCLLLASEAGYDADNDPAIRFYKQKLEKLA